MNVHELYAQLGAHIAAGHGDAKVCINYYDDTNPAVAAVSDAADWEPCELYYDAPETVGDGDGMLVIGARPDEATGDR